MKLMSLFDKRNIGRKKLLNDIKDGKDILKLLEYESKLEERLSEDLKNTIMRITNSQDSGKLIHDSLFIKLQSLQSFLESKKDSSKSELRYLLKEIEESANHMPNS